VDVVRAWLATGAWIGLLLGAAIIVLIAFFIWAIRRAAADEFDVSSALLKDLAPNDKVLSYVDCWRAYWVRMARHKGKLYHALTAVALISTSLVTAVGALGSLPFVTDKTWLLIATTFLGFIATISTGIDRMLNDRKDYIRYRRYATLLDVAQLRYVAALPNSATAGDSATAAAAMTTAESAARKTFIETVCKLRGDETSDWIQDQTSATVDPTTSGNADPKSADIARASRDVGDAKQKVEDAQGEVNSANTALQAANVQLDQAKAAGDEAAVAKAEQARADKQAALDTAQTKVKAAQADVDQKQAALDKLTKPPAPGAV
jgi:hypothetical protein